MSKEQIEAAVTELQTTVANLQQEIEDLKNHTHDRGLGLPVLPSPSEPAQEGGEPSA